MKSRKILDHRVGNVRVKLVRVTSDGDAQPHDYGISNQAWHRGMRFMKHFGADRALEVIDQRAERAADRKDFETARRWRTLITAIHAAQEDERLLGEGLH